MSDRSGSSRRIQNWLGGLKYSVTLTSTVFFATGGGRGMLFTTSATAGAKLSGSDSTMDMTPTLLQEGDDEPCSHFDRQRVVDIVRLGDRPPLPWVVILLGGDALQRVGFHENAALGPVGGL